MPGEGDVEDEGDLEEGEGEQVVVNLTEQENEAIGRLEQLGFPRDVCIQAYLSCERNEELAASYLFDAEGQD